MRRDDRGTGRLPREPVRSRREPGPQSGSWRTYLAVTGPLLLIVITLVGGIVWYNAKQASELVMAHAERLMTETSQTVTERLRLLYDPVYAIVGLSSHVEELTAPIEPERARKGGYHGLTLMLRGLRLYPQIRSLYVGFENGDFFMATHLAGENAAALHATLGAPAQAAFATEFIFTDTNGQRLVRWFFLTNDGDIIASRDDPNSTFDPRQRPWYAAARPSDTVEHSDLYIFASTGQPGFTLSRRVGTPIRGVFGADIAASDIEHFLRDLKVTPSSKTFIFTRSGEAVIFPDDPRMAAVAKTTRADATTIALPKLADFNDPVMSALFAQFKTVGNQNYTVAGRDYIGRVIEIPALYGRDQLLAVMVPLAEIAKPVIAMRNDVLFRSIVILVLVLPLYTVLLVRWVDRRLTAGASRRTG